MKKSFLVFSFLTATVFVMAQEATKQREVGLVFNNLDSFGITYKTGTNQSMWRFNTMTISGNVANSKQDSSESRNHQNGFYVEAGKEFRKLIAENFEFRYGADLFFHYSKSKNDYNDKTVANNDRILENSNYTPGINLVFGFNYIIHDKLVLGAEVMPYFSYYTTVSKVTPDDPNVDVIKRSGFSYGLSNSSAMLSVSYRF
ncbi:MAG: hypothetical protein WCX31_04775 [Salinivirgaceae bacterium]|jgi:hypothetical protein